MPIKFSNKPYLNYAGDARRMGDQSGIGSNFYQKLSPLAKPITTAPDGIVKVYDRNGNSAWAHYRRDSWRTLRNVPDWKTGKPQWMETSFSIDAVAWSSK